MSKLCKLSGTTARTLRYYDEINLLKPFKINSSGYRIYGMNEVDRLQQILFYRELGIGLDEIKSIIDNPNFNETEALSEHLSALKQKRVQLDLLIENVTKTIKKAKGEIAMTDKEKFEGFELHKKKLIEDNENQYGKEIRENYGDKVIDGSNEKILNMTVEQNQELETVTSELNETLKEAIKTGDIKGELAKRVYELHKKWISFYWNKYSKEAHIGVARMYVEDHRFTEYYDNISKGCAVFLRDVIEHHCN